MKILFVPTLGKGFGHIKRALLIISQLQSLKKDLDISIIIDNKIGAFINVPNLNTIILPFRYNNLFQEFAYSNALIDNTQYQNIVLSFIKSIKPDIVVYDFVISEPIFQLVEDYGGKNVLILREQRDKSVNYLVSSGLLDYFEKILIPHDLEYFNLSGSSYNNKTINMGPIFDRKINYDKDSIRSKFDVSEKDIWIIASCGGGGFLNEPENILEFIEYTDNYFKSKESIRFSYFKGCYTFNNFLYSSHSKSITVHDFDLNLSSYFYSADIIVSYLGYNSFYEILNSGSSATFIPATRILDDQQKRFKGKKLPENIKICLNHDEAKKQLIKLIEGYNNKELKNSSSILSENDGANIAAKELLKIAIPNTNNISVPHNSIILSQDEVLNFKDSFSKYFRKGITAFYFNKSNLSPETLQNISTFENNIKDLNISYAFHLIDNLKSNEHVKCYNNILNHVNLRITQKCNSKCIFCYHWRLNLQNPHMPLLKIIDITNQAKSLGAKSIVINGGEPTLHKDFFQILKILNDLGYSITINTNGLRLHESKFLNNLSKFPNLTLMVTVLSVKDVGLRGVSDWSSKTIGLIKSLKKGQVPFYINTNIVLNKINFNQLNLMIQKLLDANVDQITINLIDSVLDIDCSYLYLSEVQLRELYFKILPSIMLKATRKKINVKINPLFLRTCFNYVVKSRTRLWKQIFDLFFYKKNFNTELKNYTTGLYGKYFYNKIKYCLIPSRNIYVMANGDVYPCLKATGSIAFKPFGNLYYRKMSAVIRSKRWLQFINYAGNQELCDICNNAFILNLKHIFHNNANEGEGDRQFDLENARNFI